MEPGTKEHPSPSAPIRFDLKAPSLSSAKQVLDSYWVHQGLCIDIRGTVNLGLRANANGSETFALDFSTINTDSSEVDIPPLSHGHVNDVCDVYGACFPEKVAITPGLIWTSRVRRNCHAYRHYMDYVLVDRLGDSHQLMLGNKMSLDGSIDVTFDVRASQGMPMGGSVGVGLVFSTAPIAALAAADKPTGRYGYDGFGWHDQGLYPSVAIMMMRHPRGMRFELHANGTTSPGPLAMSHGVPPFTDGAWYKAHVQYDPSIQLMSIRVSLAHDTQAVPRVWYAKFHYDLQALLGGRRTWYPTFVGGTMGWLSAAITLRNLQLFRVLPSLAHSRVFSNMVEGDDMGFRATGAFLFQWLTSCGHPFRAGTRSEEEDLFPRFQLVRKLKNDGVHGQDDVYNIPQASISKVDEGKALYRITFLVQHPGAYEIYALQGDVRHSYGELYRSRNALPF